MLTLGVTYVVPVVQAASTRREIAGAIALHGDTVAELRRSLESGDFDGESVAQLIVTLTEKHGAFPVLHYLHTHEESRSAPAMIARLALAARDAVSTSALQRALDGYLRFHPEICQESNADVWLEVLRSDGRAVPDEH